MKVSFNRLGLFLTGVWLIVWGCVVLFGLTMRGLDVIQAIIAIAAGLCLIFGELGIGA